MNSLRRTVKRVLPSSLSYVWRDLKYTDIPESRNGSSLSSNRINILRSHYFPKRTIYFFPQQPLPGSVSYEGSVSRRGSVAYKLCRLLGIGITTNAPHRYEMDPPDRYDVAFKYDRSTFLDPLSSDLGAGRVVNGECSDVSKRAVNASFEEVFGYSVGVDPTTYEGKVVVKSNINATHDGRVVQGPIAAADVHPRKAYQKAIDNRTNDQTSVLDYRVPVHGDQIPLVYLKYRPVESRFVSESAHTAIEEPTEVFSEEEIGKILQLSHHMGVDFGELDVLRDKEDGRIYVVDVNPTPWGPPRGLEEADRKRSLTRLGRSFEALIQTYSVW